jgi:hypothetical protein
MALAGWLKDIMTYLNRGRAEFHANAREKESEVDESYQRSLRSALRVDDEVRRTRRNTDFIRKVMRGQHGQHP